MSKRGTGRGRGGGARQQPNALLTELFRGAHAQKQGESIATNDTRAATTATASISTNALLGLDATNPDTFPTRIIHALRPPTLLELEEFEQGMRFHELTLLSPYFLHPCFQQSGILSSLPFHPF